MRQEQRLPSPSPLNRGDFETGRSSGLFRGAVNFVIGGFALIAGDRLAVGDMRGAGITAAIDGGIIVADAVATAYIARRQRRMALQQQATIETQTAEISTLRRG